MSILSMAAELSSVHRKITELDRKVDILAKKPLDLPTVNDPVSALDGISMMAIDTDPESNVVLAVNSLLQEGPAKGELIAVLPRKFRNGRQGYLVITYRGE